MSLTILTAPSVEPISLAEAKAHLRVTTDAEDSAIQRLVVAAREQVEAECGLALIATAFRQSFDCKPRAPIPYARGPLISVDHTSDDGLTIDFTAGFGTTADAVPAGLKQAVLALVAWGFEHRGDDAAAPIPVAEPWLSPWRKLRL